MTLSADQLAAARRVVAWCDRNRFNRRALLAVAAGESSLDVEAAGDAGTSHGVFQIHIPAHGRDSNYWTGYDGIDRSADEMADRWRQTWDSLGGEPAFERQGPSFLQRFWKDGQGTEKYPTIARCVEVLAVADEALRLIDGAPAPAPIPFPAPPAPTPEAGNHVLRVIGRALIAAGRVLDEEG